MINTSIIPLLFRLYIYILFSIYISFLQVSLSIVKEYKHRKIRYSYAEENKQQNKNNRFAKGIKERRTIAEDEAHLKITDYNLFWINFFFNNMIERFIGWVSLCVLINEYFVKETIVSDFGIFHFVLFFVSILGITGRLGNIVESLNRIGI